MKTWLDFEHRFRTLAEPLRFLRLDVYWGGSTGEGWHLAAIDRTAAIVEFEALSAIAGDALVKAFTDSAQNPDWLSDPKSDRRWYRALKELSGAFAFGHIVGEADEDGKKTGTIYSGSINNIVEVSANFCLTMHRKFPIRPESDHHGVQSSVTNIFLNNSQVGLLHSGQIQHVQSITANIRHLQGSGSSNIAEAIEKLTQAVTGSQKLQDQEKTVVLEQLEELSKQAVLPADQRVKPGALKAVVNGVATTLGAAGGLAEVWSTWGPVVMRFFGL
jgi:hypothetical protein